MNVTPGQQTLILADANLPARGKLQPEAAVAQRLANDGEPRKQLTVLSSPSSTVVFVRADYFSRTDARERAFIADASYSNSRTPRRNEPQSPPITRQFATRGDGTLSNRNPIALYTQVQGDAKPFKGAHIDVFA